MYQSTKPSDGFVAQADFEYVWDAVRNNRFPQLVQDLIDREPEIAFGVADRFHRVLRILDELQMTPGQRIAIDRLLTLLAWSPLIATTRAYRRAWQDLLPDDGAEGGGE